MAESYPDRVENTVGKGEIARYEQFLLFPMCFQKACFQGASKGVIVLEWVNPLLQRVVLMHQQQTAFEKNVGIEEIACNQQLLLFPQCFLLNQKIVSPFVKIFNIISLFDAEVLS